ncbi:hypothetical protein D1007_08588 [Hordeum vulgare]|nr:hypothetical protein D1007_08588 [Hordeum vulgare]
MGVTAYECIDMQILQEAEVFTRQWVYVDAAQGSPMLLTLSSPAVSISGWGKERLDNPRLSRVMKMLASMRAMGVTVAMSGREFLKWWIAPLQRHSCSMWVFTGTGDTMRLCATLCRLTC